MTNENNVPENERWLHQPKAADDLQRAMKAATNTQPNTLSTADMELRLGAAILLQVAEMEEHNEAIFKGKWEKGSKAWSGEMITRLREQGMSRIRQAMTLIDATK